MLGGLTQREDHEKKLLWLRSARLALEASTAIAFYACTMDPRISESLNWLSWIATEKLLDHNDGQLAKWTQGRLNGTPSCSKSDATRKIKILLKDPKLISLKNNRIHGRKNRTKLNTKTDRLAKTPNLSGMLPFYSCSANCVAHLQTGSHLDPLLHLASDSQSHSMAAPALL
ncbi:hypothetical protein T12_13949 [Trichinella patagoniensis]|uniref:Uncharacterized protein n=1 Tax=Trichinella patagoniensis TaxID=990121 RepID=A0A0V0ZMC8_9BILA|nr:hypothetical protein T12_13949 [Trichinella patagoniensis]